MPIDIVLPRLNSYNKRMHIANPIADDLSIYPPDKNTVRKIIGKPGRVNSFDYTT